MTKIWEEIDKNTVLIVSNQAREVIKHYGINEKQFLNRLKKLFKECFVDLPFPFHRIEVSKTSTPELRDEESELPHLKVEFLDAWRRENE